MTRREAQNGLPPNNSASGKRDFTTDAAWKSGPLETYASWDEDAGTVRVLLPSEADLIPEDAIAFSQAIERAAIVAAKRQARKELLAELIEWLKERAKASSLADEMSYRTSMDALNELEDKACVPRTADVDP